MSGRTKKGTINIISGIINQIILLLLSFGVRTVIIKTIGIDYLGLNSLFSSILTILNLTELGIGGAIVFSMYVPIKNNDYSTIGALLHYYKRIFSIIGLIVLAIGVIITPFITFLINGDIPVDVDVHVLFLIFLIDTVITYLFFPERKSLLTAYQRFDIISIINTLVKVLLYSLQIISLLLFKNYYIYIILLPLFTFAECLFNYFWSKKLFDKIKVIGELSIDKKKEITKHVKGIALRKISSVSRNSLDSIVISLFLGLSTIAIYNNYFYIMNAVHAFLYIIPNAIRSIVGSYMCSESKENQYLLFKKISFFYIFIVSVCFSCMFSLYQPFMKMWVGVDLMFPFLPMVLFCLYFYVLSLSDVVSLFDDASGLWWHGRFKTIIESILNLSLNFLLGYFWGVNGILIATLFTMFIFGFLWEALIVYRYCFDIKKFKSFVIKQTLLFAFVFVISIGTYFVNINIHLYAFFEIIVKGIICILLMSFSFFVIFFKTTYFKYLKDFVIIVFKRKK